MGAPALPSGTTRDASPSTQFEAVTPGTPLATQARSFYIGVGGNIVVRAADGTDVTFTGVLAGQVLPVVSKLVVSSGTTATNIVALY